MRVPNFSALFEKPSTWLIVLGVLLTTSICLLLTGSAEWSSWGAFAVWTGFVGRFWTMGHIEGVQKRLRTSLWMIATILCLPVFAHQLRRGPDGEPVTLPGKFLALGPALVSDVRRNMATPVPLKGTISTKSELLGAVETEYLSLTNVEEKALVFIRCELHSRSNVNVLKLPVLIKPYETLEVELKTGRGKHHFSSGDVIIIECEGYDKPWTISSR